MMRTPDGHGRLELMSYPTPATIIAESKLAPPHTLGLRRIMFAVDDIDRQRSGHANADRSDLACGEVRVCVGAGGDGGPLVAGAHSLVVAQAGAGDGARRGP
jgi:hypothetical protein